MAMFNIFVFYNIFLPLLLLQSLLQLASLINSLQPSLVTRSLFTIDLKAGTC